jgi:hypothetical protein
MDFSSHAKQVSIYSKIADDSVERRFGKAGLFLGTPWRLEIALSGVLPQLRHHAKLSPERRKSETPHDAIATFLGNCRKCVKTIFGEFQKKYSGSIPVILMGHATWTTLLGTVTAVFPPRW